MNKIIPHLWYDNDAAQAAELYVKTFPDSRILEKTVIQNTPSGSVETLTIELMGQAFALISAGPHFKFNPSISFLVACDTIEEVDQYWAHLSNGGSVLMDIGTYPNSGRYGWLQDKFGLSWQLMLTDEMNAQQKITPTLMFVGEQVGKAETAIHFYLSVFNDTAMEEPLRWESGEGPDSAGTIKHGGFTLEKLDFAAMDSAHQHDFMFNEAISFIVNCEDQAEIDYYWEKLSADPTAEQCGWLKDQFGISWQIVPTILKELLCDSDKETLERVSRVLLKMKKLNINELLQARRGG